MKAPLLIAICFLAAFLGYCIYGIVYDHESDAGAWVGLVCSAAIIWAIFYKTNKDNEREDN